MEWTEVSKEARETMDELGNFGPTGNIANKEVKGYLHDEEGGGKAYYSSNELREMAKHFIEVAEKIMNEETDIPPQKRGIRGYLKSVFAKNLR